MMGALPCAASPLAASVIRPCPSALHASQPARRLRSLIARAEGGPADGARPSAISEDLIARLKAAEEEAQRLKRELADAKAQAVADTPSAEGAQPVAATKRIDSGDLRRETLAFVESKERNWLNETDMDFFTGGGPSEAEGAPAASEEEGAVVRRRLLLGLGLAAAAGAFALVPTEKLQAPPAKPLFFYLVPLALLDEAERIIPDGNYEALRSLLARIQGPPNNVQDNLRSAAASLPDSRRVAAADSLARDVYEYIRGIDYQTYYDSVGGAVGSRGGSGQKQLFEYSLSSAAAAKRTLGQFLATMPGEQLEAARQQAAASPF